MHAQVHMHTHTFTHIFTFVPGISMIIPFDVVRPKLLLVWVMHSQPVKLFPQCCGQLRGQGQEHSVVRVYTDEAKSRASARVLPSSLALHTFFHLCSASIMVPVPLKTETIYLHTSHPNSHPNVLCWTGSSSWAGADSCFSWIDPFHYPSTFPLLPMADQTLASWHSHSCILILYVVFLFGPGEKSGMQFE